MASQLERLRSLKPAIEHIAAVHGASDICVFGSVARGEEREDSDVDLLISLDYAHGGFALVRFQREIQELLGTKVDVITRNGIYWRLRDIIVNEAVPL